MKFYKTLMLVSCLAIMPIAQAEVTLNTKPVAVNQTPSDESLQKLMQVMQVENTFREISNNSKQAIDQAIKQMYQSSLKDESLTQAQNDQIQQVISDFAQKMLAEQTKPEIYQQCINSYISTAKTMYSQDEVNAMIDFYGSPLGQSVSKKQSAFSTAYIQKLMPIIIDTQQKALQKYMPELQQKIQQIIQSNPKTSKAHTISNKRVNKK